MAFNIIVSFVGKRVLVALGVLAATFAGLMAFQSGLWGYIAVSVLFIGYASWTASAFFVTQKNFSWRRISACAWPVGVAMVQALVCWGVVWVIVGSTRHLWGR